MSTAVFREEKLKKRHLRIRKKIFGIADHPRLSVHRSHLNLTVQVVNDESERTLFSSSTLAADFRPKGKKQFGNIEGAKKFGAYLGEQLKKHKITRIIFDRGGYPYHGRIKAFAESLRESGIQF
ncbi:MAG: 50S ribosomal protein L18 [Omnitrophica bacterium RIFCSPHIGHO2_02_FULL_46_11]|nr:MAG: 50S ribosomal protein L18 [Omnitrophica bacterium RIFCSPLOWO2_01_FULL_45_10b]OGW86523.1 MAG: 50S ribosomal protein L18 [Omnitrophica bacterium RIFCSPHIGHO2_02_FULL_46_11]